MPSMVGLGQSLKKFGGNMWEEFYEIFMGKYFLASTRHAKAREFLELKQGTMTMLEYVVKLWPVTPQPGTLC